MTDDYPHWAQSLQKQLRKCCEDESSEPCYLPPHLAIEALDDYGTLQMENAALEAELQQLREHMVRLDDIHHDFTHDLIPANRFYAFVGDILAKVKVGK